MDDFAGSSKTTLTDYEMIERFLDYLIDPNECIDTYGRTYIDDLEFILAENHLFDFQTQTFPDQEAQQWFERVRSRFNFAKIEEFIGYVREHLSELDLANIRPRSTFQTETLFEKEQSFQDLKRLGDSVERSNEFQRAISTESVKSIPHNELDGDYYELYMSFDRTNPWTYVIRREIARGNLAPDDQVLCIGNRWLGEIFYFRQNLGLKNAKGVDLISSDPELVIAADMHKLPFPDNSVKMIFNRGLINKSYDVRLFVKEMMRVLTKDGYLIVETPGPYEYGVSRLGRTDIKSAKNLLRLLRGKVRRVVYSDAMKPHQYLFDATKLVRICVELDKDGCDPVPKVEAFPQFYFGIYDVCRRWYVEARYVLKDPAEMKARVRNFTARVRRSVVGRVKNPIMAKAVALSQSSNPRTRYLMTWVKLLRGAWIHARGGDTPRSAHVALIDLFVASGGRDNDILAKAVGMAHPPYRLPPATGVLGNLGDNDLAKVQRQLEVDGYYVFENCLSGEFCERLVRQTQAVDCMIMGDNIPEGFVRGRYERGGTPKAAKYLLTEDDSTDIPEVQELISDPSIIAVAQNYLKSKPIFSGISLWWSPTFAGAPDNQAAQQFHWDMERIKWIRFFIYLTDVTADSGPHCFIKGSHGTGAIPDSLLKLGYVRHSDETMLGVFGKDSYMEFVGQRGTIIAEDSRGFHKGMEPKKGDRLLLAFELSNTTFGANKRHLIRNIHVPRFGEFAKRYPRVYSNFDFPTDA
jgi:SAM-dependent methyltransferase/ectoine hydroxylase-related dioxygenase (phytanoyl-CoA dioxygenase family)